MIDQPESPQKYRPFHSTASEVHGVRKMLFFFVCLAALAAVFFSGVPFLSREAVDARLKSMAADLSAYAKESGGEAQFTYGAVEIVGAGYEKKALIHNPSITLSHTVWLGSDTFTFSTPQMLFVPDTSGSGRFAIQFSAPVALAMDGAPAYTITFAGGEPHYVMGRHGLGQGAQFVHSLALPPKLVVTPASGSADGSFTVTYDANPKLQLQHIPATGWAQTTMAFQNLVITGAKTGINVASLTSQLMRQPAAGGKLAFDATVTVNDVGIKGEHGMDGPYSLKLSTNGTRVAPARGAVLPPPDTDVNLREFSLSADKFHLTATGSLSRKPDDSLPYGTADVKVENFSSLRGSPTLSPEWKAALVDAATRIAGADAATADNFAFTIKREKLGKLVVGNAGLADVATAFLSHLMLGVPGQQPSQPVILEMAPAAGATPQPQPAPAAAPTPAPAPKTATPAR